MISPIIRFLVVTCLLFTAPFLSAQVTFSFDSVDYGSNPDHINAGGPEIEPDFDPDTDPQSRDFEIGSGVTMNLKWDFPNTDSGHWPARYDIVVDDRYINPGPDGLKETADDLGTTLRLQNGSATDAGAPPHEGSTASGNSHNGIYTFTFSEPVFLKGWDAGGLDYGGPRAEHLRIDVYSDLAKTALVEADSITNISWHEGNEGVDDSEGALIDDSITDGDGYHAMATDSGNDIESVFRFDFTTTPVRVIVMEFYATEGAPNSYRKDGDTVADDGLVIDLTQNPGAIDPDNVFLNQIPDATVDTPTISTRGRSAHFGILDFKPAERTCNVAYICGVNKEEDADSFDHGMISYLETAYSSFVTPVVVEDTGGGALTATNLNDNLAFALTTGNFDSFDYVVISSSLEAGSGYGNLWTPMKDTTANILSFARRTAVNVGMGTSFTNLGGTDHFYPELGSNIKILNYPTTIPTHPYTIGGIRNPGSDAEVLLELPSDNTYKTFVRYQTGETLADSTTAPGVRVFYSMNIDGVHQEPGSSGTPVPMSEWFDPTTDLTAAGLGFLKNALDSVACPPDCSIEIDSVVASNYRLESGVWTFDLAVQVTYVGAPETTVTINGQNFTIAGAVDSDATETFDLSIPVTGFVEAEFPNFSGGDENKVAILNVPLPSPVVCSEGNNDLGGLAFLDLDRDGVNDSNEPAYSVAGMYVAAYSPSGFVAATPVSSDGTYSFPGIFNTESSIRLEFHGLPEGAGFGPFGGNSNTSVQFHTATSCAADIGVVTVECVDEAPANALVNTFNPVVFGIENAEYFPLPNVTELSLVRFFSY